jgi:hypothetical protein
MTDANRHNDHLTADDLRKYRDKTLSAAEQHRVERLLLENPLYADALEGLEAAGQETAEQNRVSGELRKRLKNRVADKKIRRLPVWIPAAAASVVLVLSIGLYLRLQEKPQADQMVGSPAPRISASKEAAPAVEPTETRQPEPLPEMAAEPKRPLLARKTAPIPARDSLIISKDYLSAAASKPGFSYRPLPSSKEEVVVLPTESVDNQELSGQVVGENNEPLPGASVVAKNSRRGGSTDSLGRFRL